MTTTEEIQQQERKEIVLKMTMNTVENEKEIEVVIKERENSFEVKVNKEKKYFFEWEHKRENFLSFILSALETPEYLYYKIANRGKKYSVDVFETTSNLNRLINQKLDFITEKENQYLLEQVNEMKKKQEMNYEELEQVWGKKFDVLISKGFLEKSAWVDENVFFLEDEECIAFCVNVAPQMAKIIKDQMNKMGDGYDRT